MSTTLGIIILSVALVVAWGIVYAALVAAARYDEGGRDD